jgi:hypothetical protein
MGSGLDVKNITTVIYQFLKEPVVFVLDRSNKPSLMFVGKDGAYQSEALFRWSTLK